MIWKLAIVVVLRMMLTQPAAQVSLCAALLILRGILVLIFKPYRRKLHNRSELALGALAAVVLIVGVIFFVTEGSITTLAGQALFGVVLVCLGAMFIVAVVCTWHTWKQSKEAIQQRADDRHITVAQALMEAMADVNEGRGALPELDAISAVDARINAINIDKAALNGLDHPLLDALDSTADCVLKTRPMPSYQLHTEDVTHGR